MLKQMVQYDDGAFFATAAFRRLCVETLMALYTSVQAAQPPLGGCVLKQQYVTAYNSVPASRL